MSRRRDTLSFQHHAEVAALAGARQDLWLGRAERCTGPATSSAGGWRPGAHPRPAFAGHVIVVRMRVARTRERHWREAAEASRQPLAEWLAAAADVLANTVHVPAPLTNMPDAPRRPAAATQRGGAKPAPAALTR